MSPAMTSSEGKLFVGHGMKQQRLATSLLMIDLLGETGWFGELTAHGASGAKNLRVQAAVICCVTLPTPRVRHTEAE